MFCAVCGSKVVEGAGFCGKCGSKVGAQNHIQQSGGLSIEDVAALHRRMAYASERERKAGEAAQQAALATQEYTRLRNRRTNCTIAGIMLAFLLGYAFLIPVKDSSNVGSIILMASLGAFVGLTFPFGFMPIKDFISNHGFYIVFAAVFFAVLFVLVIFFTIFAGIPYFFYLQSKIGAAKRDMDLLQGHADALAATAR